VARNLIGDAPFPPVLLFDDARDFAVADLKRIAQERPNGVSLCIRYSTGLNERGGYFFHFAPVGNKPGAFMLYDFEKTAVHEFSADALVAFVNHCTGRRFDEPSFTLCQTEINFWKDDEPDA
jgi:hypothetical protein